MAEAQAQGPPIADRGQGLPAEPQPGSFAPTRAPSIGLPKGGGGIRGIGETFSTNPSTGTASLSIPLVTSPGRAGFGPQLALSYDSGAGNGPFGLGWTLSLPEIARSTDKRLPLYRDSDASDAFVLSGAEELVPALAEQPDGSWALQSTDRTVDGVDYTVDRFHPRVEGMFARIERWTRADGDVHWRSISSDNVTTWYGKTAESRIADPADARRVFSWLICESRDDKGNAIVYEYVPEDSVGVDLFGRDEANRTDEQRSANRYLRRVRYGNTVSHLVESDLAGSDWLFEVVFDYLSEIREGEERGQHLTVAAPDEEGRVFVSAPLAAPCEWDVRLDPHSSFRAGFERRTYRLCRRVLVFHHFPDELGVDAYLVRSTDLGHRQTPVATFLTQATQSGYVRAEDGRYLRRSLPPLDLAYAPVELDQTVHEVDPASLSALPEGVDGIRYQWVDLDGDGVAGVLSEQAEGWFYKRNLTPVNVIERDGEPRAEASLGPATLVASRPAAGLVSGRAQFLDLAGDGRADLVTLHGPVPGLYERDFADGWSSFRPFPSPPSFDPSDPNLRFVDLDGDGRADALLTSDDAFAWHRSLGEDGFGPAARVPVALDEERGPKLVFADATQSIHLADMSGDGLTDLVRILDGEVCYWPNLGHGRFGAKIAMAGAPALDGASIFDPARVRLLDADGSGTTDLAYLGSDGVRLHFNQSGNAWSDPVELEGFPHVGDLATVAAVDLLGNGTGCLVWSSEGIADSGRQLRYVDLMSGRKPHLLVSVANNLGAETHVTYAPSTRFFLADELAGRPWFTRLPFPVHVVERVETYDRISRNRFVSRYAYHHGFYDGVEREFRGFGFVEQFDTGEFESLAGSGTSPPADNVDPASDVPPALTRTWFHTGAFTEGEQLARLYARDYYREPGLSDDEFEELLLPDTVLPPELDADEAREACRALKGSVLREETYGLDDSPRSVHPFRVAERNYTVRRLQPRETNEHAVFLTGGRELLEYHYERNPADPRVAHSLTLELNEYAQVLKAAAVGYGRRAPDPELSLADRQRQAATWVTYSETVFTNALVTDDANRTPLPAAAVTYELTGYVPSGQAGRFSAADLVEPDPGAAGRLRHVFDDEIAYEETPGPGRQRRAIEAVRNVYRRDDLDGALPVGEVQSLALAFESYILAFTPGLLAAVYGGRVSDALLGDDGRYVRTAGEVDWWRPSGRTFYSPNRADTAAQELAYARAHFFLPHRYRDPFDTDAVPTESFVRFDRYDLLLEETLDAVGNRVTVGERDPDPTQPLVRSGQDYRVLQPVLVMDANRNCSEARFDALGLLAGAAVAGKPEQQPAVGDRFDAAFAADLTQDEIDSFLADPAGPLAAALLGGASTRYVYDLTAYLREPDSDQKPPTVLAVLAREMHASEPAPAGGLRVQTTLVYSDGFDREIQKKHPAEPGPVPQRDASGNLILTADGRPVVTDEDVAPRWVGSSWNVFNNKGNIVRQFEPFFTDRHRFERDLRVGVSPVVFYDALERAVGTLRPDHTWEKVAFDAWRQTSWDAADTVLVADPATDVDLADYFARLSSWEYLPSWHDASVGGELGANAQAAARKAELYAETPTRTYTDALGRTFLTVALNRFKYSDDPETPPSEERQETRIVHDVEGNQLEVMDALGRVVVRYRYDLLGHRVRQASMEAGDRWLLHDAAEKLIAVWDSRGHRTRTVYDPLRRPSRSLLLDGGGDELLVGRTVYGEGQADAEAANLRGKPVEVFDQAGVVTNAAFDFKGNLTRAERRFAESYSTTLDWSGPVPLQTETHVTGAAFDALSRPTELVSPDGSVVRPRYNQANLLESVDANLRGEQRGGAPVWTPIVIDIDYDAKGQRTLIEYGSRASNDGRGVFTTYEYDPLTFRLARLLTRRRDEDFPDDCPAPPPEGWPGCRLQNLSYTYDPVGNVTHVRDEAQQTRFFRNRRVEPGSEFTYDALYRLIEATGREHLGQAGGAPVPSSYNDRVRGGKPAPADGNAVARYRERFAYDVVGNILSLQHRGPDAANQGWTRTYDYAERSQLDPNTRSNRLTSTTVGGQAEVYSVNGNGYDPHGNLLRMPQLDAIDWDFKDQLRMSRRQAVGPNDDDGAAHQGERTWYVYDAEGKRVRKVTESAPGVVRSERTYLGNFELFRSTGVNGLVRETLHVMDDMQRVALVETRTDTEVPERLLRYQLADPLGSVILEIDAVAQVISYEEYTAYGATSLQAVRSQLEAPKRYRYTSKERDEETGLYYHGSRYYAPWLVRWTSADPLGILDGVNLYLYVGNNPIVRLDPSGTQQEQAVGLGDATVYADKVKNAAAVGSNVQKDHAIAQEIIKRILGPLAELYKPGRDLTTVVETGAAAGGASAKWHTVKSTLEKGVLKVVEKALAAGKTAEGFSLGDKVVEPVANVLKQASGTAKLTRQQYVAMLSQLGNMFATTTLEQSGELVKIIESGDEAKLAATVDKISKSQRGGAIKWLRVLRNVAKGENAAALAAKAAPVVSKVGSVVAKLAPAAKVLGKIAGPLGIGLGLGKVVTGKNDLERVDGGITAVSGALMMSKHPVAIAAGGGLMAGQVLDSTFNVSDYSSRGGVAVYEKLKDAGINDKAAFVVGGAASLAAIGPALGYGIAMNVKGWFD